MKKFLVFSILILGAISYVHGHYTLADVEAFADKKAHPTWTPRVEYYIGYYYVSQGRDDEAIKTLEHLLDAYPDNAHKNDATFHLGEAYEDERNKDKAREIYESYLENAPNGQYASLAKSKVDVIKSGG